MSSEDISSHERCVQEKKQKLKDIVEKYFPGKSQVLETCLGVRAILEIDGVTLPFMLVLLGPPSAGKSTVIMMVESLPDSLSLDSFTSKSFVSHYASKRKEDLEKDDLLNQIKNKAFLTPDLAPLFSTRDDQLVEVIGILTRVLDGQGYRKSSGVYGKRGYGKTFFVWIGAMVDVPKNIWPIIGKLGPKQFFFRIDIEELYGDEKERIMQNLHGITYDQKIQQIIEALKEYWNEVISFPVKKDGKIVWDSAKDEPSAVSMIVDHSQLLARLRAHVPTENTDGTGGSGYGFMDPLMEDPERATHALYNFARGIALCHGRNFITEEDVYAIRQIVLSSSPKERYELVKLLIKNNGELTSAQFTEQRKMSKSTALKTMKLLEILGIVDEVKVDGTTKPLLAIRLKEQFRWLLKDSK